MSFEDIKIVELDDEKTRPSEKHPALRHMFLRLSEYPERKWVEIFTRVRSIPRNMKRADAWIDGEYIVVDCAPRTVKSHLSDLKTDVSNANLKYREYLQEERIKKEHRIKKEKTEQDRLKRVKVDLDFD